MRPYLLRLTESTADQYDALIHLDVTRALKPLEPTSLWIQGQTPETYPSGL